MYEIALPGAANAYEFEELIKVFLKPSEYRARPAGGPIRGKDEINERKRELFRDLAGKTGKRPDWGILTGVRPVKLAGELIRVTGGRAPAREALLREYLLSEEKADLILDIYAYQKRLLRDAEEKTAGLYIGIPFCPTKCLYCSFPSYQASGPRIQAYLQALSREITFAASEARAAGMAVESIYIGGGTPTTLDAGSLRGLLEETTRSFDVSGLKEVTVEAGRPDTLSEEKLRATREAGANRVSVNPQSMRNKTLERIGRAHTAEETADAVRMAREAGIPVVNMDIIAGLPGEDAADFADTLRQIIAFGPENITVHTLATKRASRLIDENREFHYEQADVVREMLKDGKERLTESGYRPYYLYRQKQMAGNFENIGWCRDDAAGIYNIRVMEEAQTILALGAGGITKVFYPDENRLERVPNVSNYELYIERLDEMLSRKRNQCFPGRN